MNSTEIARIKKFLSGPEGQRITQADAERRQFERFPSSASRRAIAKLVSPTFDPSIEQKIADILAKDRRKAESALAKSQARAMKKSRARLKMLNATAARTVKQFELDVDPTPDGPEYHLVNTPIAILPTKNIELEGDQVVPGNSWAKFRVELGENERFQGDVKFYYLWSNPSDKYAVINIDGYVIVNGFGHSFTSAPPFGNGKYYALTEVFGSLHILEWWNQPPTLPLPQSGQKAILSKEKTEVDDFFFGGWSVGGYDIYRGYDLNYSILAVPPYGAVVIGVAAEVYFDVRDDSSAGVDFVSDAYQVGSPGVLITVLS